MARVRYFRRELAAQEDEPVGFPRPQAVLLVIASIDLLAAGACHTRRELTRTVVPAPAPFEEESVHYPSGELRLAAALLSPAGRGPFPAAVVIQGSGASDRTNQWARDIAEAMALRGIAVLLTDKRGSGQSAGDWRTADFDELAQDVHAGVEFLRQRPEIDPDEVGLVGLSQGGQIAPLVASRAQETVDFVVAVSSSATPLMDQVNHEMRNTFRQAGLDDAQVERGMQLQALTGEFLRTDRWEPYEAALQQALESELAPVAKGFPATRDSWVWGWWRGVIDYDPLPYWQRSRQPVLVALGERDEENNVPVAESVRRLEHALAGRSAPYEVHVFPGSGHALYEPDATEPTIRKDFVQLLVEWIHSQTR
jgi:dipeptidyl aminopeptidase/acylaminoacyl peptidase